MTFLGVVSLYLVTGNNQPNSKFRPPPKKKSGSAPESRIEFFLGPPLYNMLGVPLVQSG